MQGGLNLIMQMSWIFFCEEKCCPIHWHNEIYDTLGKRHKVSLWVSLWDKLLAVTQLNITKLKMPQDAHAKRLESHYLAVLYMNVLCRKRPSRYFAILTWYLFSDSCSIFSKLFSLLSSDDSRLSWSQSFWKQRNSNSYLSKHRKLTARQKLNTAATNKKWKYFCRFWNGTNLFFLFRCFQRIFPQS